MKQIEQAPPLSPKIRTTASSYGVAESTAKTVSERKGTICKIGQRSSSNCIETQFEELKNEV